MKLTDLNSGRTGMTRGAVTVDDFSTGSLSMSGLVPASRVEPAADPANPFVRWDRIKVLALPSRTFMRSQPVFVYYEVYGLAGPEARYRTTYTLSSLEPDRNIVARFFSAVGELLSDDEKEGAITYSFERSQTGDTEPLLEYFSPITMARCERRATRIVASITTRFRPSRSMNSSTLTAH